MKTFLELKELLPKNEWETLDELAQWYDTPEALLTAIVDEDDDLQDKVSEYADGKIDIYTNAVYEWIGDNFRAVCEYEEEAIKEYGATTIEKIGQWCQYRVAEEEANEAIASARKLLAE